MATPSFPPFPRSQVEHENHDFENSRTMIGKKFRIGGICSQYVVYNEFPVKHPSSPKKFFKQRKSEEFFFLEDKEELLGSEVFPCLILLMAFVLHPFMVNTSSVPKNIISSSHYRLRQLFPFPQLSLTSHWLLLASEPS